MFLKAHKARVIIGPHLEFIEAFRIQVWGFKIKFFDCPENGIYPTKIKMIIDNIKKLDKFIIYTCSPLVVNEFKPDEVVLVTQDEFGNNKLTMMSDLPGIEDAMKVYALGEFWISYADGFCEKSLLTGGSR